MKIILTLLLLALLGISLLLNYTFYKKAFLPLNANKLDPIGLSYYPLTVPANLNHQQPIIVFYGDSRALSWPAPKLVNKTHYQFINRAIGNQTSIQIIQRFKAHVTPLKPNTIIVQMCVNDLKMIPLFPQQKKHIIQNCQHHIDQLLQQAQQLSAQVILTTVFPLGNIHIDRQLLGIKEQPIIDAIDEINRYIHSLKSQNVIIFDSYQYLKGKGKKIDEQYSHDWLHLNAKGYQQLNKQLKKVIDTL